MDDTRRVKRGERVDEQDFVSSKLLFSFVVNKFLHTRFHFITATKQVLALVATASCLALDEQIMNWLILISTVLLAALISAAVYFHQAGAVSLPLGVALRANQPTLLLVGPSNSGKTSLFQSLLYNKKDTLTYTSQKANHGQLVLEGGKKIKVVDVPGHPKLFGLFREYRPTSIAFVLDASTLSKNVNSVAHSLLAVLTFARQQEVNEVTILANKADFFTALSDEQITELIEAEIQQIRVQKDGVQMDSIEERTDDDSDWLHDLTGDFRLKDECTLFRGSVLYGEINLWRSWIVSTFA